MSHLFLSFLNFFVPALHFFPSQCLWKQVFKRFNIKTTVLGTDFEVDWVEFFRQIVECRYSSPVALTLVCGDGPLHLQDLPTGHVTVTHKTPPKKSHRCSLVSFFYIVVSSHSSSTSPEEQYNLVRWALSCMFVCFFKYDLIYLPSMASRESIFSRAE